MKAHTTLPRWLEAPVLAVLRLAYRVRPLGTANVPAQGGIILVANHLSYADPALVQLACPRPLRFIAYSGPQTRGFIDFAIRVAGAVPVSAGPSSRWLRQGCAALARGEAVCVFAEGGISRTGQLMEILPGFEALARRSGAPVVPVGIDGIWGSVFSFSGGRYFWKVPRLGRLSVRVAFGEALAPDEARVGRVRQAIEGLIADGFAWRPALRRNLAREALRSLARRPATAAVVDRTAGRREVSAARLAAVSIVLGKWIRSHVAGRRVGIVLPPGAGAVIANLGVLCAGKVPVNLNFTAGGASAAQSIATAGVKVVITADAMRARLEDFPWPEATLDLRALIAQAGGARAVVPWLAAAWVLPAGWFAALGGPPEPGGDEEAFLLFTSGSVGEPKGVPLSHRNVLANCQQISSLSVLPPRTVLLGCLPIFHSFGLTVTLVFPLLRGCRLVTTPSPLDTRAMLDSIREEGVSVLVAAPAFLRPFLRKAEPRELVSLELVVAGSEKLPEDLARGFQERFHLRILEGYGLTETAPVAAVNQPDPPVTTAAASVQRASRRGTVGRLLPGLAARILDPETGRESLPGRPGILCLRGANVFTGYLGGAGQGPDPSGWFATADLASIDGEGFVRIEGRLARFSKIAGEMVPHGTVEQAIACAFGAEGSEVAVVAVVALADPVRGEALVVLTSLGFTLEELRRRLGAQGLPNLWVPRHVVAAAQIPVLGTGKLDLGGCRRLAAAAVGEGLR